MSEAGGVAARVVLSADALATPVGELQILCSATALCVVDFGDFRERMHMLLAQRFGAYEIVDRANPLGMTTRFERYFAGDLTALEGVPVDTGGTAYERRVWAHLRTIPAGQTRTYGELAAQLGGTHPRAVGHANSRNPVAIAVPCHRVIGANWALTGYAGGLWRKRLLLDHEAEHGVLRLFPHARWP